MRLVTAVLLIHFTVLRMTCATLEAEKASPLCTQSSCVEQVADELDCQSKDLTHSQRITCEAIRLTNRADGRFRPNFGGAADHINISIVLQNLGPVIDTEMLVKYDLYIGMEWIDKRMLYNESIAKSLTLENTVIEHDMLWTPNMYFPDASNSYIPHVIKRNAQLKIYPWGIVRYNVRVILSNECVMSFSDFPHDQQKCTMCLENYSHTEKEVQFHWQPTDPIQIRTKRFTAHYILDNIKAVTCQNSFESGNYSKLCMNLELRRKVMHYLLADYVPCALIVCLSWVSFWVSPDLVPARASLSITTVLAIITLIGSTQQRFPEVSDLKALDIYFFVSFMYVFLCLVEFAGVSYRAKKPLPRDTQFCLADMGALALKMHIDIGEEEENGNIVMDPMGTICANLAQTQALKDQSQSDKRKLVGENNKQVIQDPFLDYEKSKSASLKYARELDRTARLMFPGSFLIFNALYWCFYLFKSTKMAAHLFDTGPAERCIP